RLEAPGSSRSMWRDFLDDPLGSLANVAIAIGDTVSFGLTQRFREGMGYDDVVDKSNSFYIAGTYIGQAMNVGLMWANPASVAGAFSSLAGRTLQTVQVIGGTVAGVDAFRQGDVLGGMMALGGTGTAALRGISPCGWTSVVGAWGQ